MELSELPFEILLQIADSLSTRDRLSCALTCMGWRYLFQSALWTSIRTNDFCNIKILIDIIKGSKNTFVSYGLWVYSLRIGHYYVESRASETQFSELVKCLPNLKHLDLDERSHIYFDTDTARSNKKLNSLKSLKIGYTTNKYIQPTKNVLKTINVCSMLQRLEIHRFRRGFRMDFSVDDFDNMHQKLQNLSSFGAEIYFNPDFPATLDKIPSTAPAFAITSVDINSKLYDSVIGQETTNDNNWNPLWLYYFGYKYPNLRSLKLHATDMRENIKYSNKRQTMISIFQSNPNAFRHLEAFSLTTDCFFEFTDLILWELFCASKVSLKHLAIDIAYGSYNYYSYPIDLNRIFQTFSETLESFSFTGWLKQQERNLCQHGLQSLTLQRCSVPAEIFNYLSFKCKSLDHMTLNTISTLEIGHLQYNISNQTINTTTCSVLTLLSQLYDAPSLNEKNKKQKTGMDSKYPIVARHNLKWFYKYWPLECYVDYNMGALKLSKEGTDTALEYYQKFHLNKASKVLKDNRFYYGHVPLVKRKCELNRGYAELRFGKIETPPVICPTKYYFSRE
ncbi:hypothetical protein PHYBLDRAFT_145645 [Phycomyces blakesleeanus NRRL 1555(-)]|uniref:F-box domain-containing protein n=1 Tax=Phycomyces blakesleeanus (strain ATCC 8743b / DSM 1359 / FGSC 10004 / NBRC 33097 / NRRL 1555) TaxID=763407 RepID=A0A163AG05_PHYB8|nr:hypothetical protein PHYBLDRAFT_145645 [Phycomyces blakesleeanus NRRL 1555(-)]OAD73241.1 hypothetical protein PHYBLDRAFT_145645 [Phycomyces blakesleeanus NRRL 1555(-)]|eukprot:XP_018291281.1 hypothetical protein PHYBLDRAFT_145645 [Phycomyces blakesleeanus NRRL 1555(-)]